MSSRQFNRKDNWFFYINQINSNNPDETILIRDNLEISGNTTLHNVSLSGNIIPCTDNTYDIGSATNKIRDLYLSNSTLFMGNQANDAVYNVLSVVNDVPTFKGVIELPDISNAATISSTLNILTVSGDASFNKNVNISGGLTIGNLNNNYIMPSTLGLSGQILTVTSAGNTLEFLNPVPSTFVSTADTDLNMSNYNISNIGAIYSTDISTADLSCVNLTVNSAYKMPTTIGSANQVLTVPVSGNVLTFADNTTGWIGTATSGLNMSNYNITGISQLQGASIITIDPSGIGDNTGLVIIKGDLQVDGTTTTINSSILDISDHRILLSSSATNDAETDGAGIEISNNKLFTYSSSDNAWNSNINMIAPKFTGDISATNLTVNSAYQMPTTIGTANQVLTVPASGNVLEFVDSAGGGGSWIGTATSGLDMSGFDISNIDNLYATTGYNTYQTLGTEKIVNPPSNTLTLGGVNIGALNKRTRTSYASAETCVSTWTTRTTNSINWWSVCWAPELGLFCATSYTGTNNRVMTSQDGITWTTQTSAANNNWHSVCWSPELSLFCAVSTTGVRNRVMTSPNGITWTTRDNIVDILWRAICWSPELGIFCAVAYSGTNNRVMTSPNGLTWTTQTTPVDNDWHSVCWSPELSLFCAVSYTGTNNRVMTSPDGLTWTTRETNNNNWWSVCWSPELLLFCAVGSGTGNCVMTSSNGITWTTRANPVNNEWHSVCWAPELSLFCAVSTTGSGNTVMTSPDGIYWTTRNGVTNTWRTICWAPELSIFCAVSDSGSVNGVMTSAIGMPNSKNVVYKDTREIRIGEKSIASGESSIAIGDNCSATGLTSVSIGIDNHSQGTNSISIGNNNRSMNENVITIGNNCGATGGAAAHTISIGERAGTELGQYSIAIGKKAAENGGSQTNCIVLNAQTDTALNPAGSSRFYVKPVRNASATNALYYDTTSGEISYDLSGGAGATEIVNTSTIRSTNSGSTTATNSVVLGISAFAIGTTTLNEVVAIGRNAAVYTSECVSVGAYAGSGSTVNSNICLGFYAGLNTSGERCIHIGRNAGNGSNGSNSISIGTEAGRKGSTRTISIGHHAAGSGNGTRGENAIAIGYRSGFTNQSTNTIAIGAYAGENDQSANSIVLNATGAEFNGGDLSGLYVKPVRNDATPTNVLFYNTTSGEISYGDEGQVTSDIRLKHNIIRVDSGLNIINKLEIKKFNKCSNFNPTESEILEAKLYVGVIAQDVLKVEPELVSGGDYLDNSGNLIETPYFVKNNNLLMYNVKATQELSDKLTDIENKLYFANNKIQQLEGQNSVLKNAINSLLKKNNLQII